MPSFMSLRLEMKWNGNHLATGTGFIVMHADRPYLVTNWHNLAGRNPGTNEVMSSHGVTPDEVHILHNTKDQLGTWMFKSERLVDIDDKPLWLEHPSGGRQVDVAALPLTNTDGVHLFPYSLDYGPEEDPVLLTPSTAVNIVGFPFAQSSVAGIGIWARGTIASEPELDYGEWPRFLIDSRTRPGQSGSPVVFFSPGGAVLRRSGTTAFGGQIIQLLGVYSGRINDQSDIGIVWKNDVIRDIVTQTWVRPVPGN